MNNVASDSAVSGDHCDAGFARLEVCAGHDAVYQLYTVRRFRLFDLTGCIKKPTIAMIAIPQPPISEMKPVKKKQLQSPCYPE